MKQIKTNVISGMEEFEEDQFEFDVGQTKDWRERNYFC